MIQKLTGKKFIVFYANRQSKEDGIKQDCCNELVSFKQILTGYVSVLTFMVFLAGCMNVFAIR